jgi:hypothetical protein
MNDMKTIRIMAAIVFLILAVIAAALPAAAGDGKDFTIGKKGEVHFNVPVKVGDTLLQPGMYQVQHVVEGSDHIIIFNKMEMPAAYRHGNTPVAKEPAARIKCKIEPVDKKVNNTKITLRTNAAGEKDVAEVQVPGEAFRHVL